VAFSKYLGVAVHHRNNNTWELIYITDVGYRRLSQKVPNYSVATLLMDRIVRRNKLNPANYVDVDDYKIYRLMDSEVKASSFLRDWGHD
jgi:hypothetical protein